MGGLNGLVNNAGILRDGLLVKKDRETGADQEALQGAVGRGHRREPHRRDAHRARHRRQDASRRGARKPGRRRQHVEHRAARQPRPVELLAPPRPRSPRTRDLVARVRALRRSASARVAPGMIETPMTQGMNQKARDALVAADPGRPHRRARGHLARREVRPRVRLLQRPHDRRRRRAWRSELARDLAPAAASSSSARRSGASRSRCRSRRRTSRRRRAAGTSASSSTP